MPLGALPSFDQLPPVPGTPKGCAWGIFDKDGVKDQVGTLNILTPSVVLEASKEIRTGESVALKYVDGDNGYTKIGHALILISYAASWGLENPPSPFYREKFHHSIKDVGKEHNMPICCFDDIVHFNTQSSSQWDGFRHWGHATTKQHYNGILHDDILGTEELSIHSEENVQLKHGDILILRTGLIQAYNKCANDEERNALMRSSNTIGTEASEDMVRWLWDNHFSAVAGDAVAFETQPFAKSYALHDYLLVWWGMPIGEMWDLEALAQKCQSLKRWTFFVTSAPLNVKGGVASPPNALAVF
ncbi:hypothetical protein FOPE_04725 [Fonsecaea pedrosoi]|nr:hypothetical protein FOPE_04725 [Fonsecaea pedrosoi]